jgi:hypothetical protein
MTTIESSAPLDDQIRTNEDEQDEQGIADTFHDAETDRFFTVEALPPGADGIELCYYWAGDDEHISEAEFRERLDSARYGRLSRDRPAYGADIEGFVLAAFDELKQGRDWDDTFEPTGDTFREIRFSLVMEFGPAILYGED